MATNLPQPTQFTINVSGLISLEDANLAVSLTILKELRKMAQVIDDLVVKVASLADVEQSAITLLNGLHTLLSTAVSTGDIAKVQQAITDLEAGRAALAAAVTANTPAQ